MNESEEQVQVALGTMMSKEDIDRTITFAFVHENYSADYLSDEEIIADMVEAFSEDKEESEFIRKNEAKILEVNHEMRGVLFEHFHNKWRQ